MIKAVIFDCFGVLVGQGFDATYRQAGGNPDIDRAFIKDLLGATNMGIITPEQMNERVCVQLGISAEAWTNAVLQTQQPDQQLLDFAKALKPTYAIGILSNANIGTLGRKFAPEQLTIFDAIVVSADVGMIKPDPEIYRLVAERLGVMPNECVFTDDNNDFCDAARAVGMQAIHYRHFLQFSEELDTLLTHA